MKCDNTCPFFERHRISGGDCGMGSEDWDISCKLHAVIVPNGECRVPGTRTFKMYELLGISAELLGTMMMSVDDERGR